MEQISKTNFRGENSWFYQILCNFKCTVENDKSRGEPFGMWKRDFTFQKAGDSVSMLRNLSEIGHKTTQNVLRLRIIPCAFNSLGIDY